jgi:hypothetical protein
VPEIMAQWGRVEALRWAGLSVSLTLNGGVMVGNFEHSTDVKVLIEIGLDSIKWFYVGAQRVNRLAELIVERLQRRDRVARSSGIAHSRPRYPAAFDGRRFQVRRDAHPSGGGGTRTRDPGIMRASGCAFTGNSPFAPSLTESHPIAPIATRFYPSGATERGARRQEDPAPD